KTAIDVQLPTDDRTVDVSIGELNNDVYMDAVLPNYMRGSNIYATDSFVYYGSSNWNAVIDIRLPTIGAYASAIADIDRYYMRLDTKPPEITIIKIEGKYMKNGTFISNPINEDEIYCVEAYWENILPKGTNITFSVSNDLSTWQIIEKNELYRFPSVCGTLAYKIDLATNSDFYSPKVSKIKLKYERGAYPSNISLDICDNGKIDWVYTEKLKTTVLTTNFATELSNYIISNPRSGIPINITVKSEGKLKLSPLIIVDIPPTLIKQIPSNITLLEDTLNHYLIDLYEYFVDDLDVKENLIFEVAYTNSTVVGISIYNYRYLSVDALNGKENDNWYGKLEIVISCADKRRQVTYSNNFSIEVTPVNDPPFIKSSPVVSAIENKFYNYNVTATDVDNDKLFYSLELMPEGMTIDENGAISWLPRQEQIGDNDVIVNVSDGELYVKQEFTIQVKSASSCMEFITVPQTEACVKSSYIYNAIAVDKVNPKNKIYYSLDLAPVGMSIDKDGKLTWTPSPENVGEFEVWVNATNNILFIIQKFKINVSYPLPTSTIIFPTNGMSINGTIRISGSASALVGKIQYVQIRIDDGAWIDAFGFDSWYFDFDTRNFEDGSHIIYARAYDGKKYSNESSVSVFIKNKKKVEEKAFSIAEIFLPLIVICISIGIISGYAIGKKKYRVRDKWKAAIDAITYSQQTITESKFKGMVVDEAETLLNQAKEYLSTGEYELAKQKAIESIGMIRASEKI
ncbi:MAG: putative Ig domain-containing protein, partial [Candidatus Thermoplasmatota archaeon]